MNGKRVSKSCLQDRIASLIWHENRKHIKLRRGLILAYTPGSKNEDEPGQFRLCLSRAGGKRPSEHEDRIVYDTLRAALKASGRMYEPLALQPNWALKGRPVTLILWREGVQEPLL